MSGKMIEFEAAGSPAPGYLATPDGAMAADAPGVIVLHAWWGLTEPFRHVCDRLAAAGFVALAPDLYRGKTTRSIERAEALATALNQEDERVRGDIAGAMRFLRHYGQPAGASATQTTNGRDKLGLVGFSLGGSYALETSVAQADEVAAVVTFYTIYTGLDYSRTKAAYLCHFAAHDAFDPPEAVAKMEQEIRAGAKQATFYTYPGTEHWFFEANRPDDFNAAAAALAWARTVTFLDARLRCV
jgi:carboxymethylenebutenolidase